MSGHDATATKRRARANASEARFIADAVYRNASKETGVKRPAWMEDKTLLPRRPPRLDHHE